MHKKNNQHHPTLDSSDRKSRENRLDEIKNMSSDDMINKYFKTTYQPPDIRQARKRFREDIEVHYDFDIPENVRNIGEDRKYLIQTYGCQMNEHDSEVMAGILTEMSYESTKEKETTKEI